MYYPSEVKNISIKLVIFFIISIFITSADNALRIFRMPIYNIIMLIMIIFFILKSLSCGKFIIAKNPLNRLFVLLLIWVSVFLIISKINFAEVLDEIYTYSWATGLNNPNLRGISFLIRLSLSVFSVIFIITAINTEKKYFIVLNLFIIIYGIFCMFPLIQIILFKFFNIGIGNIIAISSGKSFFRIGSYVGEPSVLAGIISSGYFLIFSSIERYDIKLRIPRSIIWFIFIISSVDIIFCFSTSIIVAMIIAFYLFAWKYIDKKVPKIVVSIGIIILVFFNELFYRNILIKLMHELSTINYRTLSWIIGYRTFLHNPIFGVGIGQSPFFNFLYFPTDLKIPLGVVSHYNYTATRFLPMNTYLELLAETGIIGLMLIFLIFYKIYKYQKDKNYSKNQKFIQLAFGTSLITIAISANSFPGAFYLGHTSFVLAMYIAGLRIFK